MAPPRFVALALSLLGVLLLSTPTAAQGRGPVPPVSPATSAPLVISEFLANPAAVADNVGEWFEVHNPGPDPVDLQGWTIADLDTDRHPIAGSVVIPPGGYAVLARNGDPTANGGVTPAYVYGGAIQLANTDDELLLLDPSGAEVDRVIWGPGTGLSIPNGASLERTDLGSGAGRAIRVAGATWATATVPWPGSAGDRGSPGQPYAGATPATATPTATPTQPVDPTPTETPTETPTPAPTQPGDPTATPTTASTATPTPSATPSVAPSATPTPPGAPPQLWISEFLANPRAVADNLGEWLEIHNPGPNPVNLQGWTLKDEGSDRHLIAGELLLAPGAYVVLARGGDPATNGGVNPDYLISGGLQLANSDDELLLLAPDGSLVHRVAWGPGTGLTIPDGASLEWTDFSDPGAWSKAHSPWPGSAGDLGSPGQPYASPPTATPTPTLPPGTTPTPAVTPSPTRPASWLPVSAPSPLILDEVFFRTADQEFIVLHNRGDAPLELAGWVVGDAEYPGDGEGMHALPAGVILPPDGRFVIARDGAGFLNRWGRSADAQIQATDPAIPALARRPDLATGNLALNDSGDEVLLLNPAGLVADALAYGNGDYAALGLSGTLRPPGGAGLHRTPGPDYPSQPDGRHRYLYAPPEPFAPLLPLPTSSHSNPGLDGGWVAAWGSLAARSNFSAQGTAPPAYLLAAAQGQGLDFVALADPPAGGSAHRQGNMVTLAAWGWEESAKLTAAVYGAAPAQDLDRAGLLAHVQAQSGLLQWLGSNPPAHPRVAAIGADQVSAAGGWTTLARQWAETGMAWLPAGNSNPPLPGEINPAPRYTGLAVAQMDAAGISAALAARRGWLTNRPGLWLTLRADQAWMGTVLPPVEQLQGPLAFQIHYGDLAGQRAGMTLWRNDRPLVTLDLPPADGRWSPSVPLAAGVYYVVATQADGDFAVTAPIIIPSTPPTATPTPTITPTPGPTSLPLTYGQATGPPGSLAAAKLAGLNNSVRFRAQIVAPPGLYNASIYVAEPAAVPKVGGLGVQVYLRNGDFPPLAEGDWVEVQGRLASFRGELEVIVERPEHIWRMGSGEILEPLPIQAEEVGESLEGRLVTLQGTISGWGWDNLYLAGGPAGDPVQVTVRSSLPWRRPYVNVGEVWRVTGIVSQFASTAPWNGGYRILVRYPADLVRVR